MLHYHAYDLRIASEIALPELSPVEGNDAEADVHIRLGEADRPGEGGRSLGDYIWGGDDELWFGIPETGRFLISGGREILVHREPGVAEETIRLYLLGSAFGALLLQRGLLVIHGNAIEVAGEGMVCVGPSGFGKSTLAAGMMRRGHRILADDVVPVDATHHAFPGFPRVKLWRDAAEQLTIDTSGLTRITPEDDKYNVPLGAAFHASPLRIRRIYVLERGPNADFRFEDLHGAEKLTALLANSYRPEFLLAMELRRQHLRDCAAFAKAVRVFRVTRPADRFALDELIDALVDHAGRDR